MTATSPTETKVTGQPRAIKRATGRSIDRVAFEAPPASHQPQVAFQAPPASHQPKAAFQAPPASQEPGPRGSLAGVAPFVTKSGLKVHVYKADITKLPVDAIVCATGENLCHETGVAYAIARAAGHSLKRACADYLQRKGPLCVTRVAVTTGGSLPCKMVLHAVGPRWSDYTDKRRCGQRLVDTVYNCLLTADCLRFTSIALSSISSGLVDTQFDLGDLARHRHRHTQT